MPTHSNHFHSAASAQDPLPPSRQIKARTESIDADAVVEEPAGFFPGDITITIPSSSTHWDTPGVEQERLPQRGVFPLRAPGMALMLVLILLIVGVAVLAVYPSMAHMKVVLYPRQMTWEDAQEIAASTGVPTAPGSFALSQWQEEQSSPALIVSAHGTTTRPATRATGMLDIFNTQATPQLLSAGTIVVSSTGIQVATDTTVIIPESSLPQLGETRVPAHAIVAGSGGNLPAGAITTTAGNNAVLDVKNEAFSGGTDATTSHVLTQQDVDLVAAPITQQLTAHTQAAVLAQVPATQRLLAPPQCHTTQQVTPTVGMSVDQAHLTVRVTCQAISYDLRQALAVASGLWQEHLLRQWPAARPLGHMQLIVSPEDLTRPGQHMVLHVRVRGTYSEPLSSARVQQLRRQLAGRTLWQAQQIISALPSISETDFPQLLRLLPWLCLPANPAQIVIEQVTPHVST